MDLLFFCNFPEKINTPKNIRQIRTFDRDTAAQLRPDSQKNGIKTVVNKFIKGKILSQGLVGFKFNT